MEKDKIVSIIKEYAILTLASVLLIVGVYVFKFPNHFSFGGVTGIAVLLHKLVPTLRASMFSLVINFALLFVGFGFLGSAFGAKTVYVSVLTSLGYGIMEKLFPMSAPLTTEPVLELIFAVVLPAVSAAILFNLGASSGGTDIVAMILKKYTNLNIGSALFVVDLFITVAALFVYDVQTGLFSFCGLMAKSLVIDNVIESINLSKYFTIICDDPEPICAFIHHKLNRSATLCRAQGAFMHGEKTVILTVTKRNQAVQLRNFVRATQPGAFIMITNSSEIIGKGFRGLN